MAFLTPHALEPIPSRTGRCMLLPLSGIRTLAAWEQDPTLATAWDGWEVDEDTIASEAASLPRFYFEELLTLEKVITTPNSKTELGALLASRLIAALIRWDKQYRGDFEPDPVMLSPPCRLTSCSTL